MYDDLSPYEIALANFGDAVGIIASLEISDKISPEEAHQRVRELYKQLKDLRKKERDQWEVDNEPKNKKSNKGH